MTIATTSKLAFDDIKNSGKDISQKQMILEALQSVGEPLSGRELMKLTGIEINAMSARINALKKADLVMPCARRKCSVTNTLITPVTISVDCECSSYGNGSDICTGRC